MAGLERDGDGLRLRLAPTEVDVVASLAEGLAARLADDDAQRIGGDSIVDHLAPRGSRGDPAIDAELRAMLRPDLVSLRIQRLGDLAGGLRAAGADTGYDRTLDRDEAMRMVEALNDVRIALAAIVGFEELERRDVGEDERRAETVQLLDALAWLQGGLIEFVDQA